MAREMRVNIMVRLEEKEEGYLIGCVSSPTVNGKPIYTDDDEFIGQRSPTGQPCNVHDAIDDLWAQWRAENPWRDHPAADSDFTNWLCEKHQWTYHEPAINHFIEV